MTSGRTRPSLVTCVRENGTEVEIVMKLIGAPECNARSLINEALAALLAHELKLPVPEPFVVQLERDFIEVIQDHDIKVVAARSLGANFGSRKLPDGFATVPKGLQLPKHAVEVAAEILAYDVFISNADRSPENPNLLYREPELAIFDHELAFDFDRALFWKAPWESGGISSFPLANHVLFPVVRGKNPDFGRLEHAINCLEPNRLREFGQALPDSWVGDGVAVERILRYINELSDNASQAIVHLKDALR